MLQLSGSTRLSPSLGSCPWKQREAGQAEPAGGRSHFPNSSGTMGCFFLDHCCILTAGLSLACAASPFIEAGSCDKQEQYFQPIRDLRLTGDSFSKPLSLMISDLSSFDRKTSHTHTHTDQKYCLCYNESWKSGLY